MSTGSSISTRAPRQAAKKASTKFEAQLMSSPIKAPRKTLANKPVKSAKRAKSRQNLKKEQAASSSKRSVGLSKSAPPAGPSLRKRPISVDSRSDDQESDLTSLSTPRASPVLASRTLPPEADLDGDLSRLWVLVDVNGDVFRLEDENDGVERIWWPAQLVPSEKPDFQVRLFGTLRASNVVTVDTPDSGHNGNILPLANNNDEIQFTKPVYVISSAASPKKRQKLDRADLEAKWTGRAQSEEEMPSPKFLHSVRNVPRHLWTPPDADPTLEIPGEKILAREKNTSKVYWPAQIKEYIRPKGPSRPPLYEIEWMDTLRAKITRDLFYTFEEDWLRDSSFDEVVNDTDDGPVDAAAQSPARRQPRAGGPTAERARVHRTRYPRAVRVHKASAAGDSARRAVVSGGVRGQNSVVQAASLARGSMNPQHVEDFHHCLLEWCLRGAARGARVAEGPGQREAGAVEADEETSAREVVDEANVEEVVAEVPTSNDEAADEPKSAEEPPASDSKDSTATLAGFDSFTTNSSEDPAMEERLCNPPSPTPTIQHDAGSSPALLPPSSSFSIITSDNDVAMEVSGCPAPTPTPTPDTDTDIFEDAFDTASVLSEASDVSALVSVQKPPAQVGCEAYEQLPLLRKMDYCLNVLLPELLIQINVWREGKPRRRRYMRLGETARSKNDWVFDVKRMRKLKEAELKNREVVVGGTSSRPKKGFRLA
ncbi:hypothetical protein B0H14DRAFT_2859436 [Mycena olivaceomarginata]|nr:hypothetical protein B0H14DRAFT_2859436 [Mycena olivaceomarginata]